MAEQAKRRTPLYELTVIGTDGSGTVQLKATDDDMARTESSHLLNTPEGKAELALLGIGGWLTYAHICRDGVGYEVYG